MIKLLLLAVIPFMTEHRNVAPKTEVSTNFYGSVTGIVDKAYVEGLGIEPVDTQAVIKVANDYTDAATNKAVSTANNYTDTATNGAVVAANDYTDSSVSAKEMTIHDWVESKGYATSTWVEAKNYATQAWVEAKNYVTSAWIATQNFATQAWVEAKGYCTTAWVTAQNYATQAWVEAKEYATQAWVTAQNFATQTWVEEKNYATQTQLAGYVPTSRMINDQPLTNDITIVIPDAPADYETVSNRAMSAIQPWQMSHTNQIFAAEVLSVGFSWDITSVTNAMAIINDFKEAFSGLDGTDIVGGATTIGTILLALIGAVTWLKKNKFDTSRVSASDDTFAGAVEDIAGRKVNIGVTASTHDGVIVTGQTVFVHNGTDASAPVIAAVAYNGTPITIKVDSGIQYFIRISDSLPMHFNPTTATGFATADTSITLTYSDVTTVVDLNDIAPALAAINNLAQARELLVGKEFSDVWVDYDGTGNGDATPAQIDNKPAWNDPLVITDIQMVEDANGGTHLGAVLMRKFATRYDIVFDAPNQEEATEETAQAGVYYYGLAIGQTAVNPTNLTLLELSEGDEIPYSSYSKIFKNAYRDTSKYLQQYGHNRYETSAYRQYLNSSAAKDGWWTKQHIGQSKPSSASNYSGYMRGCSSKLLSLIKPVKRRLVPNYICDGGSSSDQGVGLYTVCDKFFLPCIGEMFGTDNNNEVYFNNEYNYQYTYWRGLAKDDEMSPSNNRTDINAIRPVKRINSKTGNPVAARLRSANRGSSCIAWILGTGGDLSGSYVASSALASVPACVIY